MFQVLKPIPTNIITGFLGSGKTSLIRHVLDQKPKHEYWAILLNEFGDIGLDATLLNSQGEQTDVHIRELPGGCMCCTLGVPLQVTLNSLIKSKRPDRLIIEPTGLGHPSELIDLLKGKHYANVLQLNATIALLDARKLEDTRYTEHPIFRQQLAVSDVIVANKSDQYAPHHLPEAKAWVAQQFESSQPFWLSAEHGCIESTILDRETKHRPLQAAQMLSMTTGQQALSEQLDMNETLKDEDILCKHHSADGFEAIGWRLGQSLVFNHSALVLWLSQLRCDRAKAVLRTDQGWFSFNKVDNHLAIQPAVEQAESRIEVIAPTLENDVNEQLQRLLADPSLRVETAKEHRPSTKTQ